MARATTGKRCRVCNRTRPESDYYRRTDGRLRGECKECKRAAQLVGRLSDEAAQKRRASKLAHLQRTRQARPVARPEPPTLGPYGRCHWDEAAGRWQETLSVEGKAFLAAFLLQWPNPLAVPSKCKKMLAEAKRMNNDEDDIRAAIWHEWTRAVCRYDPDFVDPKTGRRGIEFSTYVGWYTMKALGAMLRAGRRDEHIRGVVRLDQWNGMGEQVDSLAAAFPDRRDEQAERERADEARHLTDVLLPTLDIRAELVLRRRFRLDDEPHELSAIGADLDICKERVRQIQTMALAALRAGRGVR